MEKPDQETKMRKAETNPLIAIASACALASFGIAVTAFMILNTITDQGMWAIAAMVAAPSAMGCGIAYFMHKGPGRTDSPSQQ
jgi:hypothetical protein